MSLEGIPIQKEKVGKMTFWTKVYKCQSSGFARNLVDVRDTSYFI